MNDRKQDKPDDPPYSGGEDEGSGNHQPTSEGTARANNAPFGENDDEAADMPDDSNRRAFVTPNGKKRSTTT